MKTISTLVIVAVLSLVSGTSAGDSFEAVKRKLADAGCVQLAFLNTIESEVFDQVDSSYGSAWIAHDGRYLVQLNDDRYLYDLQHLYSYSHENNQVTVEKIENESSTNSAVDFITHLDDYYQSSAVVADREYRLVLKEGVDGDVPDSLYVFIDKEALTLDKLKYFDVNEELNHLYISKQWTSDECDSSLFVPSFHDSVDVVRIP